jgi:hypothetical protein
MDFLTAFESIGDNCEFGLIQKNYGFDDGSLLKWARIPKVDQLVNFFENDFQDFYLLENIFPKWNDMIEDRKYGLWFHSDLSSKVVEKQRRWCIEDADERKRIYDIEYEKRSYLVEKLKTTLAEGAKIFVYKMNDGIEHSELTRLHAALQRHGNCTLLYVQQANQGEECYRAADLGEGLWRSFIPRFAPYWPVSDYLPDAWETLCKEAYSAIRG